MGSRLRVTPDPEPLHEAEPAPDTGGEGTQECRRGVRGGTFLSAESRPSRRPAIGYLA
jgi:hypothetical protein